MRTDIQKIYTKNILPLTDGEKLQIATLILEEVTRKTPTAASNSDAVHALTLIANIAIDVGITDLAEKHDFYAHKKLED